MARPYTPTTPGTQRGSFELVIKAYPQGIVSPYLHSLTVGDSIHVKGPFQKLLYTPNMKKRIGMIAGGTGITPMMQLLRTILNNKQDHTQVDLLFANRAEEDILLREQLDDMAKNHPHFRVHYVLSDVPSLPTEGRPWNGLKGRIEKDMISRLLPPPSPDTLIYVCGPPGMMQAVSGEKISPSDQGSVEGHLCDLGFRGNINYEIMITLD